MVKIQISTGYLEVVENTAFPINFSVGDIRDLSQKSGTFSKSIELTGSKENIDMLGHLYDVNISDATFNINTLTTCSIIQNGTTILERGYLQLISVNKNEQSNASDENITFTAVVKDDAGDFFTNITNKYLTDVDLSDLTHEFNATNVVNSFSNDYTDGYKYILTYSPNTNIPVKEFKPAVFAKTYFDRIFARAGKSYTWADSVNCRFEKLIIPYNGDGTSINVDTYKVDFNKILTLSGSHTGGVLNLNTQNNLVAVTETVDNSNIFNPTTGQYTTPFYISTGESININANISRTITLTNPIATAVRIRNQDQNTGQWYNGSARYTVGLFAYRNGIQIGASPISQLDVTNGIAGSSSTTLQNDATVLSIALTGLNIGDIITFRVRYINQFQDGQWRNINTNAPVAVQYSFTNNCFISVTPSENNTGLFGDVDLNNFVPKQIKQSDFVKSILTMYNLFAIPDPDQPDNIILINRDDYYDSGATKDWTTKIVNNQEKVLQFLPDLSKKKMQLSYKDDSDAVNKAYKERTNETFGQIEYTFDNEYVKDIDRKELIFSPTPSALTPYGAVVPLISGSTPKTNIRILIDNGLQNLNTPINVINYTGNQVSSSTYAMASHFENPIAPSYDINFGICDYYLYEIQTPTGNNLYNLYWRRTLAQINKGKMLTAYFDLDERDIQGLKLNDKIYCERAYWNINRVIDYSANNRTFTNVELISVDDGVQLAPFKIKPVKPSRNFDFNPIKNVYIKRFYENNNVVLGGVVYGNTGVVANDGDIVVKNVTTETLNGYPVIEAPKYKAIVTQSGTDAPVITNILRNDLNVTLTSSYISVGSYEFSTLESAELINAISTEYLSFLTTEDERYITLENDFSYLVGATILEAQHNDNLKPSTTARFSVNGENLMLYTYSRATLADDILPTDINWIMTLTFYQK